MKRFIFSIFTIGIIYGVINLVLVGGQKLANKDEEAKLEELKTELSDLEASIGGYEDLIIRDRG
ncbi:hypothetical protein [Bacillus sp. X1(2014)]|uniref:hypothetical protein n=1 Tax=Bacillus sp. X1(2014) TaxID=1565991 RepID=UPI0011A33C14|nr:hypothetical protein [Bacillus sp. X1(2014)]